MYSDIEVCHPAFLEGGAKSHYLKRKLCYSRERYQLNTFSKRRKFTDHSVVLTSDGGFSSESVCNSPDKNMTGDKNGASIMFHGWSFSPLLPILTLFFLDFPGFCCPGVFLNSCSY
jgi:hypothetical protein